MGRSHRYYRIAVPRGLSPSKAGVCRRYVAEDSVPRRFIGGELETAVPEVDGPSVLTAGYREVGFRMKCESFDLLKVARRRLSEYFIQLRLGCGEITSRHVAV